MQKNYKPLGNYIQPVSGRNGDLGDLHLMGLSIQKKFIPSIANTIGTDMSTYRIIEKNQFAYGPVTSRNGDKITIALFNEYERALISQAYIPFEVTDANELNPEYLMMWFRRPEFDRYARFKSHGSAREIFDWEEMCNTLLPVPHIDKQREIVAEYNTIQNRINLNQQLIQKLEETAQAIYKQWFVEFEFPDENGQPYQSNGGEMVWNEELGKEIPEGWEVKSYEEVFNFKTGKLNSNAAISNGKFPFFTCSQETFRTNTFTFDCEALILAGNNASAIYPFKYFKGKFDAYQRTYIITPKDSCVSIYQGYYEILGRLEEFKGTSSGTATKFLTMQILNPLKIVEPEVQIYKRFTKICRPVFSEKLLAERNISSLTELKELLLSKLATIGN